ncbi:MAG: prepilin-type N-terminal cleavage/methylation domain-containing protein [Candidatus Hydrogenedentota bacterium]
MNNGLRNTQAGFTLAELVVATTLISIVLLGVYTTFQSTILHWRNGSANVKTYNSARRIFSIIEHDLGGIPNDRRGVDARHFFYGDDESLEFITVIQPMNLNELAIQRPMQVSYRVSEGRLIREERLLEGPLLANTGPNNEIHRELLELGREFEAVIADDVIRFRLKYFWTPSVDWEVGSEPTWVELIENDASNYSLPDGVAVEIILYDPAKEPATTGTRFTKTFLFDGDTSPPPNESIPDDDAEVSSNAA